MHSKTLFDKGIAKIERHIKHAKDFDPAVHPQDVKRHVHNADGVLDFLNELVSKELVQIPAEHSQKWLALEDQLTQLDESVKRG
jgi:hypothetical protein